MKKIAFLLLILTITLASCGSKYPDLGDGVYAEFVTNKGTFVAKLYNEATPLTVANFVSLAEGTNGMVDSTYKAKKFYNGLTFHRVIKDFMIQGGDPSGDGSGNPGYRFPDEIVDTLNFEKKGLLAMANSGPETNGSQFFVTLKETPWLNGRHTIFGEIVEGQAIIDSLGMVETTKPGDKPLEAIIMKEVNIIRKGKVNVPYFTKEMEKIETDKKDKQDRLDKIAAQTAKEFSEMENSVDSLSSGLRIHYIEKGKGAKPKEGSKVLMNYAGYLANGNLFDSNIMAVAEKYDVVDEARKAANQYIPVEADYGPDARLIPGFREGLLQMRVGDKAIFYIPSHLAYGEAGIPRAGIPSNADLIFEVELVEEVK